MEAQITLYEHEPPVEVHSITELDTTINAAAAYARAQGRPNIIFVETTNGNSLSMVVGAEETVLCFNYGHQDPPYFVSQGDLNTDEPVFTAFVTMEHHTEFLRRNVIPLAAGRAALREFLRDADLPKSVSWETL